MSKPTASFNGSDFASSVPGLRILSTDPYRFPNKDLDISQLANADKSVTVAAFFKDKKINVRIEIGRDTRELLDDSIDTLNGILREREAALVLSVGSSTRQWTATFANMSFSDVQGGHAVIELEFQASDPLGSDVNTTQLFSTALTGATSATNFIVGGTAKWQRPVITITISALTGGTAKLVSVGNAATGQQVNITRTWTAGDILIIDSKLKKVTVNGTEVAFTGAIPEWAPGSGTMDYSDNLTTRTRTMVGVYYKRYI